MIDYNILVQEDKNPLAYVSLMDGSVADLCLDLDTAPHWSSDSTKIAFSQQIQNFEQPRVISIVDIDSGEVVQLYDDKGHYLTGWVALPNIQQSRLVSIFSGETSTFLFSLVLDIGYTRVILFV